MWNTVVPLGYISGELGGPVYSILLAESSERGGEVRGGGYER